jgi:hypothetical protein
MTVTRVGNFNRNVPLLNRSPLQGPASRQKAGAGPPSLALPKASLACLLTFVMLIHSAACTAMPVPPVSAASLVGAWQGYDHRRMAFIRLELDRSGDGLMAVNYWPDRAGVSDPVRCYRVRWQKASPYSAVLAVSLRPAGRASERVTVTAAKGYHLEGYGSLLKLNLRLGIGHGVSWDGCFDLSRVDEYEGRARAERDALRELRLKMP